jgi:hypothetical protein
MAGLVPAMNVFELCCSRDADARHTLARGPANGRSRVAGHDGFEMPPPQFGF